MPTTIPQQENMDLCRYRSVITHDADEQAGAVTYGEWTQNYEQLSNGPFLGRVEDLALQPLTVLREASNCIILETGMVVPGAFAFGVPVNVSGDAYFCGNMIQANCLTLLHPDVEFELRTSKDFELVAAAFNPTTLVSFINDPTVDAEELEKELRATPRVFDSPVVPAFSRFIMGLLETSQQAPANLANHQAQSQIADEFLDLITTCLDTYTQSQSHVVRAGRDRLVRRVRKYLDRTWDEPINITTLCEDLSITRRTLQNAMQEVLGVSPQAYLKAVRLNGVRRALKDRDRMSTSIADIAAEWGFWHLSQFAQDYRRLFGELPSVTRNLSLAH